MSLVNPKLSTSAKKVVYMTLYNEGNVILRRHNPCGIENGICKGGYKDDVGLCCQGCKHLSPNGCTVQSLECKLWLCTDIKQTRDGRATAIALHTLRNVATDLGVPLKMRESFKECFNEP